MRSSFMHTNDSISSCSSLPRSIFPKNIFPIEKDSGSSCKCFEHSNESSSFGANLSSKARNIYPFCAKSCNFANLNTGAKYSNIPTAIKENSNQEINRRNTIKLKNGNPEPSSKPISSSTNALCPNTLKRKVTEESKPNLQVLSAKRNSNKIPTIRVVSFLKVDKGKIIGRRNFRCFLEDELDMPLNINKYLQNTENDDDVETDDETLEYYINKVRGQLEEAVEAERALKKKEAMEKKAKEKAEEQKENVQKMKKNTQDPVNFSHFNRDHIKTETVEDFQRVRSKTLKVLNNYK